MSATLTILTALRDHLQAALPGYEVALFPDHPDSYRFIHPRGAVAAGAQVGADAQGCAVSGAAKAAGTALTAATAAGEIIRVLLKG